MYFKVACYLGPSIYYVSKRLGTWVQKMAVFAALQIHMVESQWTVGHMEKEYTALYKYLLYTAQCRNVDVGVNHCKSVFHLFHCTWSSRNPSSN